MSNNKVKNKNIYKNNILIKLSYYQLVMQQGKVSIVYITLIKTV